MIISELTLKNFRNYKALHLEFDPNLNIFVGQNAQGKTNIAESIFFLALTRSHRTHTDRDLLSWDEKEMRVRLPGTPAEHPGQEGKLARSSAGSSLVRCASSLNHVHIILVSR